jgi:phosphatidylserine/phosphatidylglycerophosphate/cardiolipin synthase-like enzyme
LPGFARPGRLHHKSMVLERRVTVTGSFNYTDDANRFNDENVFFIHNADIAEYFIAEIERIFHHLAEDFQ